jgi:cell division protein FtsZ
MSKRLSDEVLALGVGSAGIRIVSALSKEPLLIDKFASISCDKSDLEVASSGEKIFIECPVDQKLSPSMVRGLAIPYHASIKRLIEGTKIVFVVAGLGGATGSGLAPIVAQIASESGVIAIGVAVMPFDYETRLRFYAGLSLRRLRTFSRGVVIIDNDELLKTSGEATLKEIYEKANRELVKTLTCLLSKPTDSSIPVGLNKLLGTMQDGYSLLGIASSSSIDKTEEALAGAVIRINKIAETREASHAVVLLSGDSSLSASDTGKTVKRLGSIMNNRGIDVEYSVNYNGDSQVLVGVLTSGFRTTKYDSYDPLASLFEENVLDDEMDYSFVPGLEALNQCD